MAKLSRYSSSLLRVGIAIVFLWFGFSQIKNPASWTRMVPEYATFLFPTTTLIYINGIIEIILATLLLMGLYTRIVSFVLGLHLLHIATIVGYGPTGARDFSLAIATFAIFLAGPDDFCLDKLKKTKVNTSINDS